MLLSYGLLSGIKIKSEERKVMEDFLMEIKLLITGENLYFNDFAQQNLPILFSLIFSLLSYFAATLVGYQAFSASEMPSLPAEASPLFRPLFPRSIERAEADLSCKMRYDCEDNICEKFGNEKHNTGREYNQNHALFKKTS